MLELISPAAAAGGGGGAAADDILCSSARGNSLNTCNQHVFSRKQEERQHTTDTRDVLL